MIQEVQVEHVGGWIDRPQRPVNREGVDGRFDIHPLREDDLEDVPGLDVLPRGVHHQHVAITVRIGDLPPLGRNVWRFASPRHWRLRPADALNQRVDARFRQQVGLLQRGLPVQDHMGHHLDGAGKMVEDQEGIGQHPHAIWQAEPLTWGGGNSWLEVTHRLIGEVADGTTAEARQWQVMVRWRPELRDHLLERHQWVAVLADRGADSGLGHRNVIAHRQERNRVRADK